MIYISQLTTSLYDKMAAQYTTYLKKGFATCNVVMHFITIII